MNFETAWIHFLRDVFASVVVIFELPKGVGTGNFVGQNIAPIALQARLDSIVILKLVVNFETVVIPVYKSSTNAGA